MDGDSYDDIWTHSTHCMILSGRYFPLRYNGLVWAAYVVYTEAVLVGIWGLPDFPEGLYGTFFSCCVTVFFSGQFLVTIPISEYFVRSVAGAWGASKVMYNRVRCTGSDALVHGLDAYDRVRKAGSQGWIWVFSVYDRVSSAGSNAWM